MLSTRNILLFILSNFICVLLLAQPDFRDGYVITNNGDTIQGQVDYRDWYINPKKINFKNTENRKFSFSTSHIKYFEVHKNKNTIEQFYAASLNIDETPIDYIIEDSTSKPKFKHVSYFLRYLVRGELTLFELIDDREKKHLIIKKGEHKVEALLYKKYYAIKAKDDLSPNYVKKLAEVNKFRVQLRESTLDCYSITDDEIQNLRFEQAMIRRFILKYNNCAHPEKLSYIEPEDNWQFKFWAGGGMGYTNFLAISDIDRMSFLNSLDFPPKLYPTVSAGLQITLPKTSEKLHLCAELIYKSYSYETNFDVNISQGTITNDANIDFSYIQPNLLLRFTPYSKNLTVGFDFGYAVNGVGNIDVLVNENYNNGFSREFSYNPITGEKDAQRSLIGGMFIGYKDKLHLHFKYENFYTVYSQITIDMQTFYTYLTYTF